MLCIDLLMTGCNEIKNNDMPQVLSWERELSTVLRDTYDRIKVEGSAASKADENSSPGIQLSVRSEKLNINWHRAVGCLERTQNGSCPAITTQNPIRIASITKVFVAVAILRLWETGEIDIYQSIEGLISETHASMLSAANYNVAKITPLHLLSHTSGLFDYADTKTFINQFHAFPEKIWSRTEQLALAVQLGKAYGKPGEVVRYSDTGYILLGEIIEKIHGKPLGQSLREIMDYQTIGLTATWMEGEEEAPKKIPARVHQYDAELDNYDLNASFDIYGGGGLVSTVMDLVQFIRALFGHKIYRQPSTLKKMLNTVTVDRGGPAAYGHSEQVPGLHRLGIKSDFNGKVFGHTGYFGTYMGYAPSLDLAVGFSINVNNTTERSRFIKDIFDVFEVKS